eukprot:scaffold3743_cov389-Prasinococcus_capsulatus_cf.AAC.12
MVDWQQLWDNIVLTFRNLSPYLYTSIGISMSIGLSVLGAAWYAPRVRGAAKCAQEPCNSERAASPAHTNLGCCDRGIFVTGSSLMGAAIKAPRITSKNLIRYGRAEPPRL